MRTLLETITNRTAETFTEVDLKDKVAFRNWYNDESWKRWYAHWMMTSEKFYEELVAEGLQETAAQVRRHIEFQKKYGPKVES